MSGRRPADKWEGRVQTLASLTISGFWHLLVLAVLAMAVHPFQLPMQESPPVELQLLPPLPDLIPQPKPKLRPLQRERAESPRPPPLERTRPEDQVLEKQPEIAPPKAQQRTLLDAHVHDRRLSGMNRDVLDVRQERRHGKIPGVGTRNVAHARDFRPRLTEVGAAVKRRRLRAGP